mmetsp:Transcript_28589/g.57106  ORF Transcript_28589/g.57106 Transcript_28589/m.57106 type:complete len:102 (+) Transcript_28589:1875-2180(+)
MRGAGPVDGDPEYINSAQAERSGFIGPIHAIHEIAKKLDLRQGKLMMHVNKISSFQKGDPPRPGEGALWNHCGDYDPHEGPPCVDASQDDARNLSEAPPGP